MQDYDLDTEFTCLAPEEWLDAEDDPTLEELLDSFDSVFPFIIPE